MKKKIALVLPAFASVAAFAEGNTSSGVQIVTEVKTGLETFMTSATPIVVALVTAGVALWAGFALVPLMKRAWKMFTGR